MVRYSGTSEAGLPISFRVVTKDGRTKIMRARRRRAHRVLVRHQPRRIQDQLVAHITKLRGKVFPDGTLEVYYAPDDDTEYLVEGTLKKRKAKLNVVVGGRFGADGIPNAGDFDCDNWGTRYQAKASSLSSTS